MSPLAHLLRLVIRVYQLTLSALIGRQCRFAPTCSEYAREAIAVHGALRGSWLAGRRLCRCHPWGAWGYDPVPKASRRPSGATRLCRDAAERREV